MASIHWYLTGFILGTFKYIPAHFFLQQAVQISGDDPLSFFEVFLTTFTGSIVSMALFYFTSEFLMERAAKKRHCAYIKAKSEGVEFKRKKAFTKLNKLMVRVKVKFGIVAFTFIVPLIFSIPLGSIICAKFYGHHKKTYPLMVLNMAIYGLIMSGLTTMIYG